MDLETYKDCWALIFLYEDRKLVLWFWCLRPQKEGEDLLFPSDDFAITVLKSGDDPQCAGEEVGFAGNQPEIRIWYHTGLMWRKDEILFVQESAQI